MPFVFVTLNFLKQADFFFLFHRFFLFKGNSLLSLP